MPIDPVKTNGGRRQKPPDLKTVAGFGAHLMRDMSIKARALAKSACSPPARLLAAGVPHGRLDLLCTWGPMTSVLARSLCRRHVLRQR